MDRVEGPFPAISPPEWCQTALSGPQKMGLKTALLRRSLRLPWDVGSNLDTRAFGTARASDEECQC